MSTKHQGPPDAGVGKRRHIDRASLAEALADQDRRDALAPPASLTTTMGAIRLLSDLILDRRDRGWTDPMLVVLLRDLGVEISPETLRVYRGRLRKERGSEIAAPPVAVPPPTPEAPPKLTVGGMKRGAASSSSTGPPVRRPAPSDQDDQPPFDRSMPFDDRV